MRIKETSIQGLYVIEGLKFKDERGFLIKPYSENFISEAYKTILNLHFKEVWFTKSRKNVIRAMHMQTGPKACEKLVSVIQGKVLDVVLDLRHDSKTFKKWHEIELSEENNLSLYIPKGCAHGYKVLTDNSIALYMATEVHDAENDTGIRWDSFGYNWGIETPILSEKDKNLKILK